MSLLLLLRNHQSGDTPEPPELEPTTASGVRTLPFPRTGGTGRNVRLELVAELGDVDAHACPRIDFADEDIIELL